MALLGNEQALSIIIKARDEASAVISSVQKSVAGFDQKIKDLKPTFQKMTFYGTAAFTAIGGAVGVAVKEAAIAEGSYNKFNTVFAEHADDMLAFVKNIRNEMPTATHEIVRMSADLQDLLIPMGLARDEATDLTKGFVTLANKLAAFNDVDPTEVLEAFKSGLAGSSEPLRRFGINALETSLEMQAMNTGLLEAGQSFKDLDPVLKSQIRAQALLSLSIEQSGDAISGFEANNDSLIRRMQDLQATFKEIKKIIGDVFIVAVDDAVKKIKPFIESTKEWITQNPQLIKQLTVLALAISAITVVVGLLGLAMAALGPMFAPLLIGGAVIAGVILLRDKLEGMLTFIDEKTGLITLFKWSWDQISTSFKEVLIPAILELWEALKPYAPVLTLIAKIIGGVLLVAITGITLAITGWVQILNYMIAIGAKFESMILNMLVKPIEFFIGVVKDAVNWVGQLIDKVSGLGLKGITSTIGKAVGSVLGFEHGGIVQGPKGMPVPIIAHGQERVIPAGQSSGGGGNTFITNINNPVLNSNDDVEIFKQQFEKAFRGVLRDNKLQTT